MSHEATADRTMTEIIQQGSYVKLSESKDSSVETDSYKRTWPRFCDSLRLFRLQSISLIFGCLRRWKSNTEYRKVAMYRSRRVAASHSLLHLLPLGGALTVLILQWSNYWVGIDTDDNTLLQFAAKFHELTMQASLVEVLLCVIRAEAVNGYVPLGALSAATQPALLSYLWSLDFFSIFSTPSLRGWRKAAFIFIIPTIILLTSLVGPSTAILMIPRPNTPHVDRQRTMYVPESVESIYPSHLTQSSGLKVDFGKYNVTTQSRTTRQLRSQRQDRVQGYYDKDASQEYISELIVNDVDDDDAYPECGHRRSLQSSVDKSRNTDVSFVTLPTCLIADSYVWTSTPDDVGNRTISVTTVHPVVSTRCTSWNQESEYLKSNNQLHKDAGNNTKIAYIQDNGASLGVLFDFHTLAELASSFNDSRSVTIPRNNASLYDVAYPPIWIASPESDSKSLIAAFPYWEAAYYQNTEDPPPSLPQAMARIESESSDPNYSRSLRVRVCTISTYWNTGEMRLVEEMGEGTVHTSTLPVAKPHDARHITLDVADIISIQRPEFMSDWLNIDLRGSADIGAPLSDVLFGASLSEVLAIAISGAPNINSFSLSNKAPPANYNKSDRSAFKFTTIIYGYGYGNKPTSVRLAIAVITAYCVVTIAYVAYILITGSQSTAWNSGIELVALALQSKRPDHLGNAGVGIDSVKTFQEGVGIRVNEDDELELVFANDRDIDKRGLRKIERNIEY